MNREEVIDKCAETFMSKPAFDMWNVATRLAGFPHEELWNLIKTKRSKKAAKINENTVLNAMDDMYWEEYTWDEHVENVKTCIAPGPVPVYKDKTMPCDE